MGKSRENHREGVAESEAIKEAFERLDTIMSRTSPQHEEYLARMRMRYPYYDGVAYQPSALRSVT